MVRCSVGVLLSVLVGTHMLGSGVSWRLRVLGLAGETEIIMDVETTQHAAASSAPLIQCLGCGLHSYVFAYESVGVPIRASDWLCCHGRQLHSCVLHMVAIEASTAAACFRPVKSVCVCLLRLNEQRSRHNVCLLSTVVAATKSHAPHQGPLASHKLPKYSPLLPLTQTVVV